MVVAVKRFEFAAGHSLPGYNGSCGNVHGHNYVLEVGVTGVVGGDGMVIDFSQLKRIVKERVVDRLDHKYLNDPEQVPPGFPCSMPTAENIVLWIVSTLKDGLSGSLKLVYVRLYETSDSYVEWRA